VTASKVLHVQATSTPVMHSWIEAIREAISRSYLGERSEVYVSENIFTSGPIWFLYFLCKLIRNLSMVHFMAAKGKA
jgi:hypothetical protein